MDEPQLKYEPLTGDVPSILQHERVTALCLSDKILAIGTVAGAIHVLDYSGNQVKRLQHHRTPVSDLSFDAAGEHVASCSKDNCVVVTSLYTDASVKHDYGQPILSVALDPRYSSRKSKEVAVVLGQTGNVMLSSQGWLGRSDTAISKGTGTQLVRWWGPLIAWITGSALMVYSTTQHLLIRTFTRPTKGAAAAYNHASLQWGLNGWLYASWPDCIKVARTFTVENNIGGSSMQVELVAEWTPQQLVLGVSPFGRDLAVMTFTAGWVPPAQPQLPGPAGKEQAQPAAQLSEPPQAAGMQLRITTIHGGELACDALEVGRLPALLPTGTARQYTLVPSLPATTTAATAAKRTRQRPAPVQVLTSPALTPRPTVRTPAEASQAEGSQGTLQPRTSSGGGAINPAAPQSARAAAIAAATAALDAADTPDTTAPARASRSTPTPSAGAPQASNSNATASSGPQPNPNQGATHTDTTAGPAASPSAPPSTRGSASLDASATPKPVVAHSHTPAGHPPPTPTGTSTPHSSRGGVSRAPSVILEGPDSYPTYEADAEFMYFVVTPQAVLVGRMRDLSDHCQWLGSQGRWAEALALQESKPREIRAEVQEEIVQGYIGYLLGNSLWDEAARLSHRLLRQDAPMWERWVYMFAQARQLPKLAKLLPTDRPRLSPQVYDMVLTSLLANPSDHATALELAKKWPAACYNAPALVDAVVGRMKRGGQQGETRELWLLLSHLYEGQGRPDLALTILIQQQDQSAFDFLGSHHEGLLSGLSGRRLAQLVQLDAPRAIRLLVRHLDIVPPAEMVPGLQEAMADAETPEEREKWRKLLWTYLAAVHDADTTAAQQYDELQVSLTADYAPSKLLDLLSSSSTVPLESALAICEDKGLVAEQVFILGRMGNPLRALHLIIDRLGDIPQAIQFVQGQGDDELWEQLINWALSSPETTGSLLDHIGGYLNPLLLVKRIPYGLTIPKLRDRIRSIITDFRTQTSLREGCNRILRSDCARLATNLYAGSTAAVHSVYLAPEPGRPGSALTRLYHTPTGVTLRLDAWGRYDSSQYSLQPLSTPQDIPSTVAQAEAAMLDITELPGPGGKARGSKGPDGVAHGHQRSTASDQRPSHVWVGCLPSISSEETLSPNSHLSTPGKVHKHSAPSHAARRRHHPTSPPHHSASATQRHGDAAHHRELPSLVT